MVGQHIQSGCCGFEIFENYSDSLDIMETQQIDRFTNKTSTQSQKSNHRLSVDRSQRDSQIPEEDFEAIDNDNGDAVLDDQRFLNDDQATLDSNFVSAGSIQQQVFSTNANLSSAHGSHSASCHQVPQIYLKNLNTARKQIQL